MFQKSGFNPVRQDLSGNFGVRSCPVRKLICPVRSSPNFTIVKWYLYYKRELLYIAILAVMVITDKKSGYFCVVLRLTKLYLLPKKLKRKIVVLCTTNPNNNKHF